MKTDTKQELGEEINTSTAHPTQDSHAQQRRWFTHKLNIQRCDVHYTRMNGANPSHEREKKKTRKKSWANTRAKEREGEWNGPTFWKSINDARFAHAHAAVPFFPSFCVFSKYADPTHYSHGAAYFSLKVWIFWIPFSAASSYFSREYSHFFRILDEIEIWSSEYITIWRRWIFFFFKKFFILYIRYVTISKFKCNRVFTFRFAFILRSFWMCLSFFIQIFFRKYKFRRLWNLVSGADPEYPSGRGNSKNSQTVLFSKFSSENHLY